MNAEFCGSIIGADCKVGDSTHVDQCMFMDHCDVGSECRVVSSIVASDVEIGSNCKVTNCVLGPGVVIEPGTSLSSKLVVKRSDLENVQDELSSIQDSAQGPVTRSLEVWFAQQEGEETAEATEEKEGEEKGSQSDVCMLPINYDTPNKWIEWSRESFSKCQGFESDDEEDESVENLNNNYYNGLNDFVKNLEDRHGENMADILTEINCFRMSCNCSYSDIVRNLVAIMIEFCWKPKETLDDWVGSSRFTHM